MPTLHHRVRVLPGGRIEITDPALEAGTEAEVVVTVPETSGDGAPPGASPADDVSTVRPGGLPLVDENGMPVSLPPLMRDPNRPRVDLVDLIGFRPSGRTAEEIDREIREFRGDDADGR